MMDEEKDENAASSPAQDVRTESSTVETTEAQPAEGTAKQPVEKEVPFHEHPRWKEIQQEKEEAKRRAAFLEGQLQAIQQQQNKPIAEEDLYTGLSAEEKVAYQNLDARTKKIFMKEIQARESQYENRIARAEGVIARIAEKEFRKENPDLEQNSPEEARIAKLIGAGLDAEEAAWAVLGKKRAERAALEKETQLKTKQQAKTQEKIQANLETKSVSTTLQPVKKESKNITMDDLEKTAKELGMTL